MTIWQPFQLFQHTNDAHLSNCFILETNACIFIITSRARLWLYDCSGSQCCRINWHFYVICDEININIFCDIMSACFCSSIRPESCDKRVKKCVICRSLSKFRTIVQWNEIQLVFKNVKCGSIQKVFVSSL